MPLDIRRRPAARRDIIEIWLHIAEENEGASNRVLDRIEEIFKMLSARPSAGRRRSELGLHIRSFPVGKNVVFYAVGVDHIDILRVLSSYRDLSDTDFGPGDD